MTVPLPASEGGADAEVGLVRGSGARTHRGGGARCVSTIIGEERRQRPALERHLITRPPLSTIVRLCLRRTLNTAKGPLRALFMQFHFE